MKKKILVIVDMQNDFLVGSLANSECQKAIPNVVDLIKADKWDNVVYTLDTHDEKYGETLEGRRIEPVHCVEHTYGHKLFPDVANALNELKHLDAIPTDEDMLKEVRKSTFGAADIAFCLNRVSDEFNGGDLEIHVCGVCTSVCVLANVVMLRSMLPNAEIVVHADACGDTSEGRHEAALRCMRAQLCDIRHGDYHSMDGDSQFPF